MMHMYVFLSCQKTYGAMLLMLSMYRDIKYWKINRPHLLGNVFPYNKCIVKVFGLLKESALE